MNAIFVTMKNNMDLVQIRHVIIFHFVLLGKKIIAPCVIKQNLITYFPLKKLVYIPEGAYYLRTNIANLVAMKNITDFFLIIHVNIWKDVFLGRTTNVILAILNNNTDLQMRIQVIKHVNKFQSVLPGKIVIVLYVILQSLITNFLTKKLVNKWKDVLHLWVDNANLVIMKKIMDSVKTGYANIWKDAFPGRISNAIFVSRYHLQLFHFMYM